MNHLDPELLAALALDDPEGLTREQLDHVVTCPSCLHEVEELRRVRDQLTAGAGGRLLETPPDSVWAQVEQARVEPSDTAVVIPLEVRSAAPVRARRSRAWVSAVAAALVVGLGVGWFGRSLVADPAPADPATTTVASTRLDALDTGEWQGTAAVVRTGGAETLRVTLTGADASQGYLEVWLLNSDGERMVSLGVLAPGGSATFPVTRDLLDRGYDIVDISREAFDDKATHSGDSLARGTLAG